MNPPSSMMIESLITLAGVVLAAIISYLLGQRKAIAEPAKLLANGYSNLVDDQRIEIKDLRTLVADLQARVDAMADKVEELEKEVERLRRQNQELGKAAEQMREQLMKIGK